MSNFTAHPRLFIAPEAIKRACHMPEKESFLARVQEQLETDGDAWCADAEVETDLYAHNGHLIRARIMQRRIQTLILRYQQTGESRFRDAAVAHVRAMGEWEYWSWIAWRSNNPQPDAIFDLSYGENSATLAIAWDLLHADLTAAEREMFLDLARNRTVASFLKHTRNSDQRAWWFGHPDCNWNTVCAGGAGMVALAMAEELAESAEILALVEESVAPFMKRLEELDGGWQEGVGYWNYGMYYAFMYLLSHECATGRAHPLIEQPATRKTLSFPLDLAPNGISIGFGDANSWRPAPFHFAAAERLGAERVLAEMQQILLAAPEIPKKGHWPDLVGLRLFFPEKALSVSDVEEEPQTTLYKGLDWAVLAHRGAEPPVICSVRGGHCRGGHDHRDLMSFNLMFGNEVLLRNPVSGGYLDTTFGPRRNDLYDVSPAAKNTLLVNGVGIEPATEVKTECLTVPGVTAQAVRIDGAAAMGLMRDGPMTDFCARLFVLLNSGSLLIIDRISAPKTALVEARFHTFGECEMAADAAFIAGNKQSVRLQFRATRPCRLIRAADPLIWPVNPSKMLRWMSTTLVDAVVFATLITSGTVTGTLELKEADGEIAVQTSVADVAQSFVFDWDLRPC